MSPTLLPEHETLIRASGISPEVVAARGYRSVTDKADLKALGFSDYQCRVPALVIPTYATDGRVAFHQLRPDSPRTSHGKLVKYERPPGSENVLDVPPPVRHLLADPSVPLVITEGSRKADAAASLGLCCIALLGVDCWRGTNGKRGKTALADWNEVALNSRDVYLAFDSDATDKAPVQRALADLKRYLESKWARVLVLRLPAGPSGGKVGLDDFLAAGHSAEDLLGLVASEEPQTRRRTQSEELVMLAVEAYRFGLSDRGEPFAVLKNGPNVARLLRGKGGSLRADLSERYAVRHDRVPSQQALVDALLVLEGRALRQPRERVHLRLARHGEAIVLDLGDESGRAIEITANGWRILNTSPVLFRRTSLTAALPEPYSPGSGDLGRLRRLLNVAEDSWPVVVGWLVADFFSDIPHPILFLRGQQGSAKTTAARVLSMLIDPSPVPVRAVPKSPDDWAVVAAGSWLVALDNLSTIPDWLSDALCRAVTADGWTKRTLYSDDGVTALNSMNAVILTAIEVGAIRGDLGDRLLPVDLQPIPDARRKLDKELKAFEAAERPVILSGLLDLVSKVMAAAESGERPEGLPRMADFGLLLHHLDQVLGSDAFDRYMRLTEAVAEEVLESDEVAQALLAFVEQTPARAWTGTATQLLNNLTPEHPSKSWPKVAHALSGRLWRVRPALMKAKGLEIEFDRAGGRDRQRIIRLRLVRGMDANGRSADAFRTLSNAQERPHSEFKNGPADASDALDAFPATPSVRDICERAVSGLREVVEATLRNGYGVSDERTAKTASAASGASAGAKVIDLPVHRVPPPRGTRVRVERLNGEPGWHLTRLDGRPAHAGLFVSEQAARACAGDRGWRLVEGAFEVMGGEQTT